MPDELTQELLRRQFDEKAKAAQAKDPKWKQYLRSAIEGGVDTIRGFAGVGNDSKGSRLGEFLQAGMPFASYKSVLKNIAGKPAVFHGAPKPFDKFDTTKANKKDTLGWMTHAAENPNYAEDYALKMGDPSGTDAPYPPWMDGTDIELRQKTRQARPHIIPVTSTAKNVLDITDMPEGEDLEKLLAGLKMWDPEKSAFGSGERLTRGKADDLFDDVNIVKQDHKQWTDYRNEVKAKNPANLNWILDHESVSPAATWLKDARVPLNDPEIMDKLGFDAVRYWDVSEKSWAFPDPGKLETPWGLPLGNKTRILQPGKSPLEQDYPALYKFLKGAF